MSNTYKANVTRDGKWWMIDVPELDAVTQARNEGEVQVMARDLIATILDCPVDDVAVDLNFET